MCRCRRDGFTTMTIIVIFILISTITIDVNCMLNLHLNQSFPIRSHFLKLVGFVVSHFQRWHRSSANKVAGNYSKTSKCDYDLDDDAHNDGDGDHSDDFVDKICQ